MNFSQAYHFLLSLQNLRSPSDEEETATARFTRLEFFLALFDNPHYKIPAYIHVTGTSGKGSTATMIAAIWSAGGKRTGLLTSPHISHITERWQIDGHPMSQTDFIQLVTELKTAFDEFFFRHPAEWITYHEILTLLGFIYFERKKVEMAVIEVGIGGDLDATNIIPHKQAAVITTVGADHLELLGPTLDDVARHKAGIITTKTQVITGLTNPEHLAIIAHSAHATKSTLHTVPLTYEIVAKTLNQTIFRHTEETYEIYAFGEHQIKNALVALHTASALGMPIPAIRQGLRDARFPLRFELAATEPFCIVDGAHNPEKLLATVEALTEFRYLAEQKTGIRPNIHLVIGFSRNKDIEEAVRVLAKTQPTSIATTRFVDNPFRSAATPGIIATLCHTALPTTYVKPFVDSHDAFMFAKNQAARSDIILITGSIFLGGELRPLALKKLRK